MEIETEYLDKVLIYSNENLIGTYKPTIDKKTCHPNPLDFQNVDINTVIKNENGIKTSKTSLKTISGTNKCHKKTTHIIKLKNVDLKVLRNTKYDEYIIFMTQNPKVASTDTVFLEMSPKTKKKNIKSNEKTNKSKKKILKRRKRIKKPKNYKNLIGIEKIFEETIKNKLISSLDLENLVASAIFQTNSEQTPKAFLTQSITKLKDIKAFLKNIKIMNCNKTVNYQNLTLKHVIAFIVLNKQTQKLYLELNENTYESVKKISWHSQIIQYDEKKFINADVKLHNLKWYVLKTYKPKPKAAKSNYSTRTTNSMVSINEYSFTNVYEMIQQYEENLMSNYYVSENKSTDTIVKETYKVLVELQFNAIDQCNQLFFNYFNNKIHWPQENITRFSIEIQKNFNLLLNLQNKAIEKSIFTNKKLKEINKFLNVLSDQAAEQNSKLIIPRKSNSTNSNSLNISRNITSCSDYKLSRQISQTITITRSPNVHEIEVQTNLNDVQELLLKVDSINKCNKGCSTIKMNDLLMDKKCVQTDISVNKHTSIDCGGKCVQICKKNICLTGKPTKITEDKLLKEISISASEKEILNQIAKVDNKKITTNVNQQNCEETAVEEITADNLSDLQSKMDKLTLILQKIQEESRPKELHFAEKKLTTIPEEPKPDDMKAASKTQEIICQIKNSLERVKERFDKNSLILQKVSDLKDNYMVVSNIKKMMETPMKTADFPGKPKFVKISSHQSLTSELTSYSSSSTIRSVQDTKDEITKNLQASLQLLKNLNEVTKSIKVSPQAAMIRLNEIEESLQLQRRLAPRFKYEKSNLTLTPIKNFINSNKMKVSTSNTAKLPKSDGKRKTKTVISINSKTKVSPSVNTEKIIESNRQKQLRKRAKPSNIKIKKPSITKIPKVQTTVSTIATVPKIYRPISPKILPDTPKLSSLTLTDVAPFQPEYPRKDNLCHIDVEKSYLYKLLNNSFSDKGLEPLIVCSNKECTSCMTIAKINEKKIENRPKSRNSNISRKAKNSNVIWEKMHWNTEITCQTDHDFDFQQYMNDPNFKRPQTVTVCPVNVTFDRNNEKNLTHTMDKNMKQAMEKNLKLLHNAITVRKAPVVSANNERNMTQAMERNLKILHNAVSARKSPVVPGNPKLNVLSSKTYTAKHQSRVQNSIQQAILRNQERFKFIEQTLSPQRNQNVPKFKKMPPKIPKIVSSGTINTKKMVFQTKINPQLLGNRNDLSSRRAQRSFSSKDDSVFNKKYKENLILPSSQSGKNRVEDGDLNKMYQVVRVPQVQADMQKYIELVEQKFLKTFSMPEKDKATAYTSLESEIKEMLNVINSTKAKKKGSELNKTESKSPTTNSGKSSKCSTPNSGKSSKQSTTDSSKAPKSSTADSSKIPKTLPTDSAKTPKTLPPDSDKAPKPPTPDSGKASKLPRPDSSKTPKRPTADSSKAPKTPPLDSSKAPTADSGKTPTADTGKSPKLPPADTGKIPKTPPPDSGKVPKPPTVDSCKTPKPPTTDSGKSPKLPTTDPGKSPKLPALDTGKSQKQLPTADTAKSQKQLPTADTGKSPKLPTTDSGKSQKIPASDSCKIPKVIIEKPKSSKTSGKSSKSSQKLKKTTQTKKSETVIVIKKPEPENFKSRSDVAMKGKKKTCEKSRPTICAEPIKISDSYSSVVLKQNTILPFEIEPKKSLPILKYYTNIQYITNSQNSSVQNFNLQYFNLQNSNLQNSRSKTDSKKVRFQLDSMKNTISNSSVTMSTDEDYSTFYEETVSNFSSEPEIAHILITQNTDFSVFISLKHMYFIEYPYIYSEIYYVIIFYEQTKNITMPENYDYKFLCNNDQYQYSINFEPEKLKPTEVVYKSDSLSEFLVNCDELIERTKRLHLDRRKSPEILEFLNVITSISVEHLGLKKEQYYRFMSKVSFLQHTPQIHYLLQTFHQPENIGDSGPLIKRQIDELGLTNNLQKVIFTTSNIVPFQDMRVHKNFSDSEFNNLLFQHHFPFNDLVKCCSDTNCCLTYKSRRQNSSICQTLVLNLQVQNCSHKSKYVRRNIRKNCFVLPYKNKVQLKSIEDELDLDKKILVGTVYTKLLITLYLLVYSFTFLLLTFNYKCE